MTRRLYMRIYLATLAALALVVVLSAVFRQFGPDALGRTDFDGMVAAMAVQTLPVNADPAAMQARLAGLLTDPVEGLGLFDARGKLIARAGRRVYLPSGSAHSFPSALRIIRLPDGRVLAVNSHGLAVRQHLQGIAATALIALAVGLAMYPISRRLTRRLEQLTASVDRFGAGDLAARAREDGRDEVSRLASSFNQMAGRVAALLDAHGHLLVNASHELRSPLARVRLALDLYETRPEPLLMQTMRRDCLEMGEQIEEILLSSKLETAQTTFDARPLDLAALLAEESSRLDIPFQVTPAVVNGDGHLLRRLIRNLLENARRHGGGDMDAEVSIDDGGLANLQVRDRGPGIAEAERERIFQPFYRPGNARESGSGWGLGLALVAQIAALHGGSVRCRDRLGGGCVFELSLPLAPPGR